MVQSPHFLEGGESDDVGEEGKNKKMIKFTLSALVSNWLRCCSAESEIMKKKPRQTHEYDLILKSTNQRSTLPMKMIGNA